MQALFEPGSFHPVLPFHMVWIATDFCNARCAHCSSNSTVHSPDELTTAEAIDMIDQFANNGLLDLAISGGEPLLRRDLVDIIGHATARGISVGVGSNGAYLSKRKASALVQGGITRFQVSIDGLRSSHEMLRLWPGLFNRVLRTVNTAMDAGLKTHVCCTLSRLNWHELESFTEFVVSLGVARLNFSRYVPTGRGDDTLDLTQDEWHDSIILIQNLKEKYKEHLEITSHLAQQIMVDPDVRDMPGYIGCQAGSGQGAVTANGTVLPCILLPVDVGNIREQSFAEIWLSSDVIKNLKGRNDLQGACASCGYQSRCGGCRAVAYAKTGDYLAEDPRCWLTDSSSFTEQHNPEKESVKVQFAERYV